jgi:predicted peptidase
MQKKLYRILVIMFTLLLSLVLAQSTIAQPPAPAKKPMPKFPMRIDPDPRVEQRKYHFEETDEDLGYVLYVSSKVSKDKKNPLIVALHGLGGDANFIVRDRLVDLAEEGGYIAVGPLGYNVRGWYGVPMTFSGFGKTPPKEAQTDDNADPKPKPKTSLFFNPDDPPNLIELSEKDVMNVVAMMQKEFNVDENRIYLMGHSMGGAGALHLGQKYKEKWAAVAAIAPAAFTMLPDRAEMLTSIHDAKLPVMIVQGVEDYAVEIQYTHQWIETMKELKMDYYYLEFPFGDHGTIIADGMPDIFRFFARYTKAGKIEIERPVFFNRKTAPPANE